MLKFLTIAGFFLFEIGTCFGQSKIFYNKQGEITLGELATHYRVGSVDTIKNKFVGLVSEFTMKGKKYLEIQYDTEGNKVKLNYSRKKLILDVEFSNNEPRTSIPDSILQSILNKERFQQSLYIRKRDFPELKSIFRTTHSPDTSILNGEIFTAVEEMPVFPGGLEKLGSFLNDNLVFPDEAKKRGVSGRVFVQFTILTDGSVSNLKVIKGLGLGCDESALYAISVLPDWKPGYQHGKPVTVRMVLPISFR